METYALTRDCRLHLYPTAFLCGEKRHANGSSSEAKYEGIGKQKRNLKDLFLKAILFLYLTQKVGLICAYLFIYLLYLPRQSDEGTATLWIYVGLTSAEKKIKLQVPLAMVWQTRLSFQGRTAEERKRK